MKPILAAIVIASSLSSCCSTTGDPSEGGLFCWSKRKSDQRIEGKKLENEGIKANTQEKWAETRRLKSQMEGAR